MSWELVSLNLGSLRHQHCSLKGNLKVVKSLKCPPSSYAQELPSVNRRHVKFRRDVLPNSLKGCISTLRNLVKWRFWFSVSHQPWCNKSASLFFQESKSEVWLRAVESEIFKWHRWFLCISADIAADTCFLFLKWEANRSLTLAPDQVAFLVAKAKGKDFRLLCSNPKVKSLFSLA